MTSIIFLNRVSPPDAGATGRCLADLVPRLTRAGLSIRVVADGSGDGTTGHDAVVERTGRAIPGGARPRARDYLGALIRMAAVAARGRRADVVVSMTDPPLLGGVGLALARRWGAASVHWCQDLHPQLLPLLGRRIPPLVGALANATIRRHDRVIAVDPDMGERLVGEIGIAPERVRVIPNWADPGIRALPVGGGALRAELGLEGRFVALLAGTLGLTHPIAPLLDAARLARDAAPDVVLVVAGEGRRRGELERAARAGGFDNIRFLPWIPDERLSDLTALGDVHLVPMHPDAVGLMLPRKLAAAAAAARPAILIGPTESRVARDLRERGAGDAVPASDGAALFAAIRDRRDDPALARDEGRRGLERARAWDADRGAARFLETVDEALVRASRRRR